MGDRFGAFEMVREVRGLGTEEDRMRSTQSIVPCHCLVFFQSQSSKCGLPEYAVGHGISLCVCVAPQLPPN